MGSPALAARGWGTSEPRLQPRTSPHLLRGSRGSGLAREKGRTSGHAPPPAQLCGGWPPKGPIHDPGGHTKTSLSSMGVGHQRKGRSGGLERKEGRQEGGGKEETEWGRGRATCSSKYACPREWEQTTACHQTSPLLCSQGFWPSNPLQPRLKERSPDPRLTRSANPLSSQAGTCARH